MIFRSPHNSWCWPFGVLVGSCFSRPLFCGCLCAIFWTVAKAKKHKHVDLQIEKTHFCNQIASVVLFMHCRSLVFCCSMSGKSYLFVHKHHMECFCLVIAFLIPALLPENATPYSRLEWHFEMSLWSRH